ncbi:MAG: hypothetical protein CMC93_02720 [Flavobacteriaceae bacterium]|nr:hypothetical protein [Flavobacteriaceae bacterium]|tara:strand:- start:3212 stop:3601 length:390 start_codon:yes stop_codon:yes gene_type:complete
MKLYKILSFLISIVVLSAWTFKLKQPSVFRGGTTSNMSEEFAAYGLDDTIMIGVGVFKVSLAILLLIGAYKFPKLIKPAALGIALFMLGAVYFHISIGDGIVPTLPAASMLLCCLVLVLSPKGIGNPKG